MYMQLMRLKDNGSDTIGTLYVNGEFECFTLEDPNNFPKVYGKTRIPNGTYDIVLRPEGGMNSKYMAKYPNHKGMLWLQNVENFKYIYIHVGNTEKDTEGCILVGKSCNSIDGSVGHSKVAYTALYAKVMSAMDRGEQVSIEVI